MRRAIVAGLVLAGTAALAAGGWWLSTRPKPLHPISALPVGDYLYPGGRMDDRSPQLQRCNPNIPGWVMTFQTDARRGQVGTWYEERFGPRLFRTQSRYRVYEDITVALQNPWDGLVVVYAYETSSHECASRSGEPWDDDPLSTYAYEHGDGQALWVDGWRYGRDPDQLGQAEPPAGWQSRDMTRIDASVAVNPDDRTDIWVRIGSEPWMLYRTALAYGDL